MFSLYNSFLFYSFSGILVISAFMVVIAQHSVFSLLFLVLSFLCSSFLLLLLGCEFLALIFIVIYVGAIAVLFLFAVMMLESKLQSLSKNLIKYIPVGFLFVFIFLFPILYQIFSKFDSETLDLNNSYSKVYIDWYNLIDLTAEINVYGQVLYSYFILQFLVVGLILLVVLIGVVYLTNTYNNKHYLNQAVFKQLSVTSTFFSQKFT